MIHSTNVIVAGVDMEVEFEFAGDIENLSEDFDDDIEREYSDIDIISVYHGKEDNLVDLAGVLDEETLSNIEEQIMSMYE